MRIDSIFLSLLSRPVVMVVFALFLSGPAAAAAMPSPPPAHRPFAEAESLVVAGRPTAAEASARRAMEKLASRGGISAADSAEGLDWWARSGALQGRSKRPELLEGARRALALRQAAGSDSVTLARAEMTLSEVLYSQGDPPSAREHAVAAAGVLRRLNPGGSLDESRALILLTRAEIELGNLAGARAHIDRARVIREKLLPPDSPDVARALETWANVVNRMGSPAQARDTVERSLRIRERVLGPDHPEVGLSLNLILGTSYAMQDLSRARQAGERALAIYELNYGKDDPRLAFILNNLAGVRRSFGDYDGARRAVERALPLFEKAFGKESDQTATCLNNLGTFARLSGDIPAARDFTQRAADLWTRLKGPDHPDVATALTNLGSIESEFGDQARAVELTRRAIDIRTRSAGPEYFGIGECRMNEGLYEVLRGNYAQGDSVLLAGMGLAARYLGARNPSMATSLLARARARGAIGDLDSALALALEAERTGSEHLRLSAQGLPESEALGYAATRASGLDFCLSLAGRNLLRKPAQRRAIWNAVMKSRGIVLEEMSQRQHALAHRSDPAVDSLRAALAGARATLAGLEVQGPRPKQTPEEFSGALIGARAAVDKADLALAEVSREYRSERSRAELDLASVATRLPRGAALVSFVRYMDLPDVAAGASGAHGPDWRKRFDQPRYAALVLGSSGSEPRVLALGDGATLEDALANWRRRLAAPPGEGAAGRAAELACTEAGARVKTLLWDPVRRVVPSATTLYVVPDAQLHLVNLAALPDGKGSYLAESGPLLIMLGTERDLVPEDPVGERAGAGMLAVGGADFDRAPSSDGNAAGLAGAPSEEFRGASPDCEDFRATRFPPLPGTRAEADEVAAQWSHGPAGSSGGAVVLSGGGADETSFKRSARGHRVLHLATHGFFVGGDCAFATAGTRGVGGMAPANGSAAPRRPFQSPLRFAGLALAGANHRSEAGPGEDDGILTAEEVSALDLSGTDWAVLSGCDTGLGEIGKSEGVFGLQRAFRVAGAHTVIMSLWNVQDQGARRWMRALYRARLEGHLGSAASVRRAQVEVLRGRRKAHLDTHPFRWAAFLATGSAD